MALLGNLKGSAQVFQDTEFYNGVATQSLRFNSSGDGRLEKTPNASNRKTWTWSAWVKRSRLSVERAIWSVTSSAHFAVFFNSDDSLRVWTNGGNGAIYTNALFRDVSAWYHIALTSKNSGNYFELYINGVKETSFSYDNRSNYPSTNDTEVNSNAVHYLGAWNNGGLLYFDGYLADVNFLDGITVGDTNGVLDEFIEIKNGVCIPKEYTGSYGTNGYRLEFKQTGISGGTGSSSTVGADTSGNTNHYDSSGIYSFDSNMADCPENNFPTFNLLVNTNGSTQTDIRDGALYVNKTGLTYSYYQSTMAVKSGKWYAEYRPSGTINNPFIGVTNQNMNTYMTGDSVDPHLTAGTVWYNGNNASDGHGHFDGSFVSASSFSGGVGYVAGDIIGVAIDMDSSPNTVAFYKNGSLVTTKNLTSNFDDHLTFALNIYNTNRMYINFGQDDTFTGNYGSHTTNTDENGQGLFRYAVPSGYLALCSANLPQPTIGPDSATQADDHFNTVLYTGDGSGQSITGVGFQPDWTWIKSRSHASSHVLTDSSRGVTKSLFSDTNGAEQTLSGGVTAFGTDGFTLGSEGTVNTSSRTYVGWNWKANGGTTSSNSDGSITSTVQANQTAGFSIVTFTGTGSNATVGHGLSLAPTVIIFKNRDNSYSWSTYVKEIGAGNRLTLEENAASSSSSTSFNSTDPTNSVFSVGTNVSTNKSGDDIIAYCFHSVEGYSKIGSSYTGNGNADGAFVFTGFRPALIIIKQTNSTNNWRIIDNKRDGYNGSTKVMYPSVSNAEGSEVGADLLSNGFKLRADTAGTNASSGTFIYLAFAENPFKFANAR